jgi:hypothetical protein
VALLADGLSLAIFVVVGLGMSALVTQLHRARRRAEATAINAELIREMTERQRAEETLRRSEAYLAEGQTTTWV